MRVSQAKPIPIEVVGSSKFGLYPKISAERTYNMFISDGWLVNYSGWQKVSDTGVAATGRGLFHSIRGGFAVGVIGSRVYKFSNNMVGEPVGSISTSSGEVSIDENLSQQICIVDGSHAYIYDYDNTQAVTKQVGFSAGLVPGYVVYHNTFFLIASAPTSTNPQLWYAAVKDPGDPTLITISSDDTFTLQTKPDSALAVKRLPGRGNHVIVFGSAVAEVWTNVGGAENYRRNASFNIDSGAVSINTIAANEEFVCWLGQNENNAPALMMTDGSSTKRISTDGIDGLMQSLIRPDKSTAFFYRQDGHLFYQLTFFDSQDDLSLIYDFTTNLFFHVSNENLNYHPARQVIYFNEKTYFASLNDGCIYSMGTNFISYNNDLDDTLQGEEIPRIRICNTVRREDSSRFIARRFAFWIEQGVNDFFLLNADVVDCTGQLITELGGDDIITEGGVRMLTEEGYCIVNLNRPRVDMSFSKNGNQSFSNIVSRNMNSSGIFRNQMTWDRLGQCNEFTVKLRFNGLQRFVCNNGTLEVTV